MLTAQIAENDKRAGRMKMDLEEENIDEEGSLKWLRRGLLNYDGERIILAAQCQGQTIRATLLIFDNTVEPPC